MVAGNFKVSRILAFNAPKVLQSSLGNVLATVFEFPGLWSSTWIGRASNSSTPWADFRSRRKAPAQAQATRTSALGAEKAEVGLAASIASLSARPLGLRRCHARDHKSAVGSAVAAAAPSTAEHEEADEARRRATSARQDRHRPNSSSMVVVGSEVC